MQLTGRYTRGLFVVCVVHQAVSVWTVSDDTSSV
jgi:hypothetical protein